MGDQSLRDFLARLEAAGDLKRVRVPVSPDREMTEIQTRLLATGGPAVVFENPVDAQGNRWRHPVVVNLFGTVARVAAGMNRQPEELRQVGETLAFLRQPTPPENLREAAGHWPLLKTVMAMRPKTVSRAPCQEVVWTGDDLDLGRLPIQGCWPGEPAPLITWGLVVTRGPGDSREDQPNLGIYRMQVLGRDRTIMRWLRHRGGAQHFARWQAQHPGEGMPCAVVIGADPATILAAVTPVPETLSEYQFAGLLRGARTSLVDARTVPLQVPAQAEIVLEGHVLPETAPEGPYGDHTGYYNQVESFPVFQLSAITLRRDAYYLSTFTGRPPDEPSVLGEALNEVFIPLLQQQFPEIVDFWLPPEGCSYRIAVVSMRKHYPGHARRVMMGVWSALRQFLYTKLVIVVDDDINVRDWKDVMWAVSTRMDPMRDVMMVERTPIDYLDFASPEARLGGKMGMDATNKLPPETHREWGAVIRMDDGMVDQVTRRWAEYGLPGDGRPIWRG